MNLKGKWYLVGFLFLVACFPNEEGIEPKPRENKSVAINAGEAKNQVAFYSLENSELLAETSPEVWDIYGDENGLKLNFLRSTRVAVFTGSWDERLDTIGLQFQYLTIDAANLQWTLTEGINYVYDLGLDDNYESLGFMKLMVERSAETFKITYSILAKNTPITIEITTDYFYYSLINGEVVELPAEKDYDLVFGKYTDFVVFADEEADYLVYGALLGNAAAIQIDKAFEEVTIDDFNTEFDFLDRTTIGWDWKAYSLEKGAYEINQNSTYLIETKNGFKYKFRFVDFYDSKGVSGHPTFEYKLI